MKKVKVFAPTDSVPVKSGTGRKIVRKAQSELAQMNYRENMAKQMEPYKERNLMVHKVEKYNLVHVLEQDVQTLVLLKMNQLAQHAHQMKRSYKA